MFISGAFFSLVIVCLCICVQNTLHVDVWIPITAFVTFFLLIHVDNVSFMLWSWLHYVMWLLFHLVNVCTISTKQWHKQLYSMPCFGIEHEEKQKINRAKQPNNINNAEHNEKWSFRWQKCSRVFHIFFHLLFCRHFSLSLSSLLLYAIKMTVSLKN